MEWLRKYPRTVDVETADGVVRGSLLRDREFQKVIAVFNGIPYARPPVGELRWQPPQPVEPWEGVKVTRRYGPEAPQLGMEFMGFLRAAVQKHAFGTVQTKAYIHGARLLRTRLAAKQSEDCLYLNVRTVSPSVVGDLGAPPAPCRGDEDAGDRPPPSSGPEDTPPTHTTQGTGGAVQSTVADGGAAAARAGARLPVLVYIHGGDYHDGAGASRPFYLSNALPIKGDVVLVTFNYRLGLLGHFCHPDLSKEAEAAGRPAVSGNYSILDQASKLPSPRHMAGFPLYIAVLRWVQRNIASFGGDPENVTIMGSSAGGESVLYMMTSSLARGLFHKAICQSPACTPNSLMHLREPFACFRPSEDNGVDFAFRLVGADRGQVSRLRNAPLRQIMNAYYQDGTKRPEPRQLFYPVVDGHVIPKPPVESFLLGEQAPVPLLIGNNADEGSLCYPVTYSRTRIRDALYPSPVREAGKEAYGDEGAAALADLYDPAWRETGEGAEDGSPSDCDFFTDRVFGQKVHWLASHHHRLLRRPTFVYVFAAAPPREGQTVGAFHGAEVPYAFGSRPWFIGGPEDKRLASAMPDYWTAFARGGDPNGTLRPRVFWPSFDSEPGKGRLIVLGHAIEAREMERLERYAILHTHVHQVLADLESLRKWQAKREQHEKRATELRAAARARAIKNDTQEEEEEEREKDGSAEGGEGSAAEARVPFRQLQKQ
ncbi:unnamed protein product [Ectocarpus sp. 13 AM-2016]